MDLRIIINMFKDKLMTSNEETHDDGIQRCNFYNLSLLIDSDISAHE